MTFLQPTYLWALTGIIIPVAIHLWSKKDGKTIKVGSIQFLNQSNAIKSKNINLQEYVLLLLRILCIALLAFILAKPQFKNSTLQNKLTYIVEPSLLKNTSFKPILDTLKTSTVKLLATGFPELESEYKDTLKVPNYWQLANEMSLLKSDSIVVFSKGLVNGISGIRPQVQKGIHWVVFPTNEMKNEPLLAVKGNENINVFSIKSEADITEVNTEKIAFNDAQITWNAAKDSLTFKNTNIPVVAQKPLKVLISYTKGFETSMSFCKASLQALQTYFDSTISTEITEDSIEKNYTEYDLIFWLRNDEAPSIKNKLITYKPDLFSEKLVAETPQKNVYNLTEKLTTENIISKSFTEQLIEILMPQKALKKRIQEKDIRTINEAVITPNYSHKKEQNNIQQASIDFSNWLALGLFLVFVLERIISKIRKQ